MDPTLHPLPGAENEAEALELDELAAQLGFSVPLELPRPDLKQRVMSLTQTHITRAAEGVFVQTPFEGVSYKSLFIDRETRMHTLILRLAPGAVYPRHRHKRPEQCLVLSGEVEIDGQIRLTSGDFEWIDQQTTHDSILSRTGCDLMIIASVEDEILV